MLWAYEHRPSIPPVGIVLDPPYDGYEHKYAHGTNAIAAEVAEWAREHGEDTRLRIALCGYEGEHEMPASWECVAWTATGGMCRREGRGAANRHRERIWFSPGCRRVGQLGLGF